jgi:hypothetical protein
MHTYWRWLVIAFATIMWGFPLSVLSGFWGYGAVAGWMAGLILVLLGDLFAFIWWSNLEAQTRAVRVRRNADWRDGHRSLGD